MTARELACDPVLQGVLRASLALLLLAAAAHKLRGPAAFRAALEGYGLLPSRAAGGLARLLPLGEMLAAGALLVPGLGAVRAAPAAGLLLSYSAAVAAGLARGRRGIDCGCGGAVASPLGPALLVRNAALVGLVLLCALPIRARALGPLDLFCVTGGTLGLALLGASAERALALAPRLRALRGGA